jgi:hypothetical protein
VVVVNSEHRRCDVGCSGRSDGGGTGEVRMGFSTWSTREMIRADPRGAAAGRQRQHDDRWFSGNEASTGAVGNGHRACGLKTQGH